MSLRIVAKAPPSVRLYLGDCLEIMGCIPEKSVDMVLCDLPYGSSTGKTRAKWDLDIDLNLLVQEYLRVLKDCGTIVLFGNEPFSSSVRLSSLSSMYKYDIKWVKSKTTGFANANYRPMNKYEDIMVFSKLNASAGGKSNSMIYNPQGLITVNKTKKNTACRQGIISKDSNNVGSNNSLLAEGSTYIQKFTNYPSNVVYFDNESHYVHPTQKPVPLLEYLIKTYSNEGMTVLDSCMGSGSTGVACLNTNRKFIGIELSEKYYNVAKGRIEQCQKDLAKSK